MPNTTCIYCNSNQTIKFGKTKSGVPRYKCNSCLKTWIKDKVIINRPPEIDLVAKYFDGYSTRQLVPYYNSSPQKINKTIRNFLNEIPNWEDFIDKTVNTKKHDLVYLIGQNFSCNCDHDECNNNFLAIAVDAVSSFVLAYEISISNKSDVWDKLIRKMKDRGIVVENFISKIDTTIEESLNHHYPKSNRFTNILKASRQKEIQLYLKKEPIKSRLIEDTINNFYNFDNKTLEKVLNSNNKSFEEYIYDFKNNFINEIEKRCELTYSNSSSTNDTLLDDFKDRFEKFHMIKCEPEPLINGWISYNMLKKLDCGFNRLDYYLKQDSKTNFEDFAKNKPIALEEFKEDKLKKFLQELSTRLVYIPKINSKCDKKYLFSY